MNRMNLALGGAALVFMAVMPTAPANAAAAAVGLQAPPVTPKFFGTSAIRISAKRFWSDWERARRDASAVPEMRRLIAPALRLPRARQIAYVQSAVSHLIKWRSDTTQWGRHDYWASAEQTLKRGLGDMEDRAIVKMQALRALGVPTSDLYFTLGRDTVGGPQTVLIVRDGPAYYVLDDTGGPPYRPSHRPEFHPVLTFGYGAVWVHGKAPATARVAAKQSSGAARAFAPNH
jgi:predicted transglutaminase-like cysteine proteinase